MKPDASFLEKKDRPSRNLDICKVAFDADGVTDFYWPLDNRKSAAVMDSLVGVLIPYIKTNQKEFSELSIIRLLFKWFLCEVLRTYEAALLAERFHKDGITPNIPAHFTKVNAIYRSERIRCDFFLKQAEGPPHGRKINPRLKKLAKEILWNGCRIGLARKYGNNTGEVLCVTPCKLTLRHAKYSNKLARYSSLADWFSPIKESQILCDKIQLQSLPFLISCIRKIFLEQGTKLPDQAEIYIKEWVRHANNFVNFHLKTACNFLSAVDGEVWFGSGGSTVWQVILIEKLRNKGLKVVTHDHGSGNSHHDQIPPHWIEFMHTDQFVTFNDTVAEIKRKGFHKDLIIGQPKPSIVSLDEVLGKKTPHFPSRVIEKKGKIKKIMYVGTAFHGETTRLRPIFHDMTYFDWQVKLLSFLKKKDIEVLYKPHPEGATRLPPNFAEEFGFTTFNGRFEKIKSNVDAYLIDFIFSSTTPLVLRNELPVFFVNLGFPELLEHARKLIEQRCYYLEAKYSADSRLSIDWEVFDSFLNNEMHVFDMKFPDSYFENV